MGTLYKFLILKLLSIYVSLVWSKSEKDLPCEFSDSINITDGKIYSNGNIIHNTLLYKPENYARIKYTNDSNGYISVGGYYFRGCICQVTNCVWLCCDHYVDVDGIPTCTNPEYTTELLVEVVDQSIESYEVDLFGDSSLHKVPRLIIHEMAVYEKEEWNMNSTGYVQFVEESYKIFQETYCINSSFILFDNNYSNYEYLYNPVIISQIVALILSLPFMLVTLLLYLCISELRNLHGKCLICYVLSMIFCFALLIFSKFGGQLYFFYYYQYFWTMAGFFWLNVLCFDIFWTFSSGVVKKNERKRFWYYSLYAWGCPMILLALLIVIDNMDFIPIEFRPQIESDSIYFGGKQWVPIIYFYSILLVLILINLLFFVITLTRIVGIQRATDAILQRGSRKHNSVENRYRIHLYLRLFIVMGVMWIFELISFAVCPEGVCENVFIYIADVLNCLLGVFIFLMFVCKTNVKQMILKRIGRSGTLSRSKSNYTISTSVTSTKEATVPLRQMSRMESCSEKYSDDRFY